MNPIDFSERAPKDEECYVVKNSMRTTRYCWLGEQIMFCGSVRWHWRFSIVPETTALHKLWPVTHWLPASSIVLPATDCFTTPRA